MNYFNEFLIVALVHFLAVASPGPDFIMITRNSLIYSKKTAIYSALGLAFGILVHIAYSLAGLALIISKSIVLFSIIKFIGAGYLAYIGYKSLTAKREPEVVLDKTKQKDLSRMSALKMGFITNATNPKATLFFLSLFTVIISPSTPTWIKGLYGLEMAVATFIWFAFVATLFSSGFIKKRVKGIQFWAEKFIGVILIGFAVKLALAKNK